LQKIYVQSAPSHKNMRSESMCTHRTRLDLFRRVGVTDTADCKREGKKYVASTSSVHLFVRGYGCAYGAKAVFTHMSVLKF
jgi:hypothetical protein